MIGMVKRVFIIHRWEGTPEVDWYPWLRKELENKGFEVHVPLMPDTDNPKIENWVPYLKDMVGEPDENTYFVGHSMGCQTIMRYLEGLPEGSKVGGVVFVAGFVTLENLETEEEKELANAWLGTPLDLEKVKDKSDNFVAIFSDNDPWIPLSDSDIFKEKLGAKIIIQHEKGHFSKFDGITELPIVLENLC